MSKEQLLELLLKIPQAEVANPNWGWEGVQGYHYALAEFRKVIDGIE